MASRSADDAIQAAAKQPPEAAFHHRRALELFARGEWQAAEKMFRTAIELHPKHASLLADYGLALARVGQAEKAIAQLQASLEIDDQQPDAANNLAWILATHPGVPDGTLAIQWAERACVLTKYQRPDFLDTLAAAFARQGLVVDAVAMATVAERLAGAAHPPALEDIERHKPYYWAGLPLPPDDKQAEVLALQEQATERYLQDIVAFASRGSEWQALVRAVARALATDSNPRVRDGEVALRLATALVNAGDERISTLAVLSAAQAEQRSQAFTENVPHYAAPEFDWEFVASPQASPRACRLAHAFALAALEFERDEQVALALEAWWQALRFLPGDARALHQRGRLLAEANRVDEALRHLQCALVHQPNDARVWHLLGVVHAGQRRFELAATAFEQARQRAPDDVNVLNDLAAALLRLNEHRRALPLLERVIELDPARKYAVNSLAWLLATHPSDALRDGQRALELAEKLCVEADKGLHEFLDTLAAAQAEVGDFAAAQASLRRSLEFEVPENIEHEREMRLALYERGQPFRTVRTALLQLGDGLAEEGNLLGAAKIFSEVLRQNVRDTEARGRLAAMLIERGLYEDGLTQFAKAIELDPANARLRNDFAVALLRHGSAAAAIGQWRAALELDASRLSIANSLAWVLATHPQAEIRDGKEAVRLADEVCRQSNYLQPNYLDTLAAAYAETGQFERAVEAAAKSLSLAGVTEDTGRQERLERYRRREPFRVQTFTPEKDHEAQPPTDLATLQRAVAEQPENPSLRNDLAMACLLAGQVDQAVAQWRETVRLDPSQLRAANNFAWLLATRPTADRHTVQEAIMVAERVTSEDAANFEFFDTLAAAYARSGRFAEAIAKAEHALHLLRTASSENSGEQTQAQVAALEQRLERYRGKQVWIEEVPQR